MAVPENEVMNIIHKYNLPPFHISDSRLVPSLSCILDYDSNSTIETIVKNTREESTGILSSKTIKLRDELLPYPNVKLVFELSPGGLGSHRDRCTYLKLNVSILPLTEWLNVDPKNRLIYGLVKDDKRFYSKFNHNWIMIPFNMKIALALSDDIKSLQRSKKDLISM